MGPFGSSCFLKYSHFPSGGQARLPSITELYVLEGKFLEAIPGAPRADINIFGIASEASLDLVHRIGATGNSSCLYIGDSGQENVLV